MSGFLKLNLGDIGRGVAVAVLTAVISYLANLTTITNVDFNAVLQIAILAMLGYLAKNLLTNQNGQFLGFGKAK